LEHVPVRVNALAARAAAVAAAAALNNQRIKANPAN